MILGLNSRDKSRSSSIFQTVETSFLTCQRHWKKLRLWGSVSQTAPQHICVSPKFSILLHNLIASITLIIKGFIHKPGGLDLSRSCLSQDSWSEHWQKVSLDRWENLDSFKKLVSTIEKSQSSNLDFVLTSPSSPNSLDWDWEIRQDLKFLVNLNSFFYLNPELVDVNIFLNQDFSICPHFWARSF